MKRWLAITLVALAGFLILLLMLGNLLKQNAEQSTAVMQPSSEGQRVTALPDDTATPVENILREHLICHQDRQCELVNSLQENLGCWVAVNHIGASMIGQLSTEQLPLQQGCLNRPKPARAFCRDNLCQY